MAPYFPGTYPGEPNDIEHVEDLWDAVLAYDDVLSGLGIESARLIGHSFGGMLAAELAAHKPETHKQTGVDSHPSDSGTRTGPTPLPTGLPKTPKDWPPCCSIIPNPNWSRPP